MGMTRFGGMASVGHMWTGDELGEVSKLEDRTKVALAGTGVGLLGANQFANSSKVADQAVFRRNFAATQHAADRLRLKRANENLAQQTGLHQSARRGTRWMRTGRVNRATTEQINAQRAHDVSRHTLHVNTKYSSPAELASRAKNMRKMGGALGVAGTGITAAALLRRPKAPVYSDPYVYKAEVSTQSGVSKTISQSRYGANAEMGRAWRGPEKRNMPREAAVVGGGGAALLGGSGVAAYGAHRLRNPKVANEEPQLRAAGAKLQDRIKEAEARAAKARAKHQASRPHAKIAEEARGHHAQIPIRIQQNAAKRAAERTRSLRLVRGGAGVAALGGLAALGGAAKIEHDRNRNPVVRKALAEGKAGRGKKLKAMLKDTQFDSEGHLKKKDQELLRLRGETDLGKPSKLPVQDKGHHVHKEDKEDLKDIKRRLKTLPDEDKVGLEQHMRGKPIRMREGKEDEDDPKRVKRRLKRLPKEDKFAIEQDLHARPIKMEKGLDPKKMKSLNQPFLGAGARGILPRSKVASASEARRVANMEKLKAMTPQERTAYFDAKRAKLTNRPVRRKPE